MGGLGAQGCGFRLGDRGLRGLGRLGERRQIGASLRLDLFERRLHRGDFVGQTRDPIVVLTRGMFQCMASRGQVGERGGEFVGGFFRAHQHGVGLRDPLVDARAPLVVGFDLALQLRLFAGKPRQRGLCVRRQPSFALDVVSELNEPAVELGHALRGARLFAVERLARHGQSLQGGGRAHLGLA